MEALEQRMAKYKEAEEQAKQEGSASKMKRMGRIVKVENAHLAFLCKPVIIINLMLHNVS